MDLKCIWNLIEGFKMHWNSRRKQLTEADGKNNLETYMLCSETTGKKNGMESLYSSSRFVIIELKLETFAQCLKYINLSETVQLTMCK
jgi:hypothetical protein